MRVTPIPISVEESRWAWSRISQFRNVAVINRVTIGHEQRSRRDCALSEFPELADKPRTPKGALIRDGLFIVAWFAYHGSENEILIPGPRRSWLMDFRRANGNAMSKKLKLLTNDWLSCHKPSNRRHAYEYAPTCA